MAETKKCEYCGREINIKSRIRPFYSGEVCDPFDQERTLICTREGTGQKD
jgi:endogenous inhibitor of DNA gyrase (YacG/DUF329 family)